MILYDTCILLRHIYEKNIIGTAQVGHLHNPYYIRLDKLTRSNTLKMFPFLLFLPEVFLYSH